MAGHVLSTSTATSTATSYEAGEFGLRYSFIDYPSPVATTLDKLLGSGSEVGANLRR
jgi:hypothetical protein